MDMLRLILPSLLSLAFGMILLWIAAHYIKKAVDADSKPWIPRIAWTITAFTLMFFIFYVTRIASVNEIPRAVIDPSCVKERVYNFEDRMKNDTTKTK